MATSLATLSRVLAALLVLATPVTSDLLSPLTPFLSPLLDERCKEVACGRGKCKPLLNDSAIFLYECECDPGWRKSPLRGTDPLKFLPCTLPNCTIDPSCERASSPAQEKASGDRHPSILNPCMWVDCGGGSCNQTSQYSYTCVCEESYSNLLNAQSLPCFKECSFGMDCLNLGIPLTNESSPTDWGDIDVSKAHSLSRGKSSWLVLWALLLGVLELQTN
ncbi:uncharacterized protein LOC115750325 [Rhodamnia argentea]|uniref:Uncharacterized protein LOC115750325 n=1 Tax=Rhodamnia argentea TaxID=178133 RepID=A0A8B8Q8P0_9MYRT|nr:uncharacterized protein LOC115750325 [Rhodamnia argentea]